MTLRKAVVWNVSFLQPLTFFLWCGNRKNVSEGLLFVFFGFFEKKKMSEGSKLKCVYFKEEQI